jgi:hypothetical protein
VTTHSELPTEWRLRSGFADRGFGKEVQALDIAVNRYPGLDITDVSTDDLKALITSPPVQEAVDVISVFKVELLAALTVVPST